VAKPRAPKLKVFQAQFGFYDTVVAAPSRAAAMRVWGVRQNVFADGQAREITDEAAVAAAIAHPETVLKRPVGSSAPFELDPAALPKVPLPPRKPPPAKLEAVKSAAHRPKAPEPPPADRTALTRAETLLHEIDERRKAEEAEFRARQGALDAERKAAQLAYVEQRQAATASLVKARDAYRKAGGKD